MRERRERLVGPANWLSVPSGMKYEDFDLSIDDAPSGGYEARVLRSPTGEARNRFTVPFAADELAELLVELGAATRGARPGAAVDTGGIPAGSPKTVAAEALGKALFDAVFAGPVRDRFQRSLEKARAGESDGGLRIRLRLQAKGLAEIPWEYLFDASDESFLSLSTSLSVARYLEVPHETRRLAVALPLRIAVVGASPDDYPTLALEQEENLLAALNELPGGKVSVVKLPPTLSALSAHLRRETVHAFHFIGHGKFDPPKGGVIIFEDEDGSGVEVSAKKLSVILNNHKSLRLAVLNCCEGARIAASEPFSGVASALVRKGLPAVVAMQFPIEDSAAVLFARTFYECVAEGESLDFAVTHGRLELYAADSEAFGTPVLYMRSEDGMLFDLGPGESPVSSIPVAPPVVAASEQPSAAAAGTVARAATFEPRPAPSRVLEAPRPRRRPGPDVRALSAYGEDPSLSRRLDAEPLSPVVFEIPRELLRPGPVGEYLEVIDVDPASGCFYPPIDLDDPLLIAQDGLPPSEGSPQFHQQMVYAIASLTIQGFERALGRKVIWSPGPPPPGANKKDDSHFVQRLRIHPHALRDADSYYSPAKKALLFGYFLASAEEPGEHLPGALVFSCLAHDVVAHETAHALVDGMHRLPRVPSNPDVSSFQEAFADLVALLQHLTLVEVLYPAIVKAGGEPLALAGALGELARSFGRSGGRRATLRAAIGGYDEHGAWRLHSPDPRQYLEVLAPLERGAVLVAAVFDAFLAICNRRVGDLMSLASERPPPAAVIRRELAEKLAAEVANSARHVLTMCVRALDYCPPVDITFGEYLRAVITADCHLVRDDFLGYRAAFIEAFRRRGIYPRDVRTLSVETLRWRRAHEDELRPSPQLLALVEVLRDSSRQAEPARSRETLFQVSRATRAAMHQWLARHFEQGAAGEQDARFLGLLPGQPFEVLGARLVNRVGPDGELLRQLVVDVVQGLSVPLDAADPKGPEMHVEGGCALVVDMERLSLDYCIRKPPSESRRQRQRAYLSALGAVDDRLGEPVARLHRRGH